jgi:cell division protease FtsH
MANPTVNKPPPNALGWLVAIVIVFAVQFWMGQRASVTLDYSDFKMLLGLGQIAEVQISERTIVGTVKVPEVRSELPQPARKQLERTPDATSFEFSTLRVDDPTLYQDLTAAKVRFAGAYDSNWLGTLLSWVAPAIIFVAVWAFFFRKLGARGAGDLIGVGKSKAKVFVQKNSGVRFADVEGIDEAKTELMEVVQFLRDPGRYTKLGGHIPKGILIVGAPGTGKTLLAKAVAGEANVPFLLISGSEFVEMFVGVGAARVRDLFHQASELAPCIIFIDELDALGRARGVSGLSSHEEREQTLNQLLVEMDGFETNRGVIIMAATNRPEILDPALLRPGRFDRHVAIDRPDIRGRERILRLHARRLVLGDDVDLATVAGKTPGFAGADLANIVNEAALHASRENKSAVTMADFEAAIDRATAGLEKRGRVMNPKEKETVAYHEAGHALIAELRETTDKVSRVSIIPRGIGALGFTQQLPTEDRYLMKRGELLDRLDVLLAGRIAEQLVFGEVSTGARDDLQRATDLVRHMVTQYGMTESLGPAVFETRSHATYLNDAGVPIAREFSEETARQIDSQIQQLLTQAEARVRETIIAYRPALNELAQLLLKQETVERQSLTTILRDSKRSRTSAAVEVAALA